MIYTLFIEMKNIGVHKPVSWFGTDVPNCRDLVEVVNTFHVGCIRTEIFKSNLDVILLERRDFTLYIGLLNTKFP